VQYRDRPQPLGYLANRGPDASIVADIAWHRKAWDTEVSRQLVQALRVKIKQRHASAQLAGVGQANPSRRPGDNCHDARTRTETRRTKSDVRESGSISTM